MKPNIFDLPFKHLSLFLCASRLHQALSGCGQIIKYWDTILSHEKKMEF